jgi:UPF0755 protein
VTFVGNIFKAVISLAMIVAVIMVGAFIFTNTNLHFDFGSAASGSAGTAGQTTTSANGSKSVAFTIKPGDTVTTVADNLKASGVIDSPFFFKLQLKLKGQESQLKAGTFQLTPGMDTDKLITALTTAPVEVGTRFTVIEGTRLEEIADTLSQKGLVDKAKFLQLAGTPEGAATFNDDFLKASGKPDSQGLEGYLFPDTYEIKKTEGDNSDQIIRKMLGALEGKFDADMTKTMTERGINVQQVLAIASIVQREGKVKEELPIIASVYWNRVNNGMLLNADPAVQYAVGKEGDWWPVLSLDDLKVDSPYNSYVVTGLPPGPICSAGEDAIRAAVYPAQTDYLYFVAKNDGTGGHAFAKTLEEQERNRVQYGNR